MSELILNLLPLTKGEQEAFRAAGKGVEQRFVPQMGPSGRVLPGVDPAQFSGATVILGCPGRAQLAAAPDLRWLQTWSAGVDAYLKPGLLPEGTMVTSAVGAYGPTVAEHMFSALIALMKRLPTYRDSQRRNEWQDLGPVKGFSGFKVLIVGAGDIGLTFARLCRGVGMYTVGLKRADGPCPAELDELHRIDELDRWLPWADGVLLMLPHATETVGLMNERRLSLLRPDAYLLNGGRGSAVDLEALSRSLLAGHLAGAALDVTEPEPLPADHPLWQEERLLLTPHVAGGLHLEVTREKIAAIALENLTRYLAGEPLRNRMR